MAKMTTTATVNPTEPTPDTADKKEVEILMKEAQRRIEQPVVNDDGSADYIGKKVGPLYDGDPVPYDRDRRVFRDY